MKSLSKSILEEIKRNNIKPSLKWKFVLRNYLLWATGIIMIIIGGLSSSVIFYMLINNDWNVYNKFGTGFINFVFITMPYFWLIFLFLFLFMADYYIRNTKYGYRFSLIKIVLLSIFASIIMGVLFYSFGIGKIIDNEFSKRISIYNKLTYDRERAWMKPEKGLLIGVISSIDDNNNFIVKSLDNHNWNIKGEDILIRKMVDFSVGGRVKIIGEIKEDEVFIAKDVRPWIGRSVKSCIRRFKR